MVPAKSILVLVAMAFLLGADYANSTLGPPDTWSTPLIQLRIDARVNIDDLESTLLSRLSTSSLRSNVEVAQLLLLAKTNPDSARAISKRILSGEFLQNRQNADGNWFARYAAEVLAVQGETAPFLTLLGGRKDIESAWVLAKTGDFRLASYFTQQLAEAQGDGFYHVAVRVEPFMAESTKVRNEIIAQLLKRLESGDEFAAGYAADALERSRDRLNSRQVKQLGMIVAKLLSEQQGWKGELGSALFTRWIEQLRGDGVTEALLRLAATSPKRRTARAANEAAVRTGLLMAPLPPNSITLMDEGLDTIRTDRSIDPVSFLLSHPFADHWVIFLDSADEVTAFQVIDAFSRNSTEIVDRAEKQEAILRNRRISERQTLRLATLKLFPASSGRARVIRRAATIANDLQIENLALLFPDSLPKGKVRAAQTSSRNSNSAWIRLAHALNSVRACENAVPAPLIGLTDDRDVESYIAQLSGLVGCPATGFE
jgi:hypothetical protein